MNTDTEDLVQKFIAKIKEKYSQKIIIDYEFNSDTGGYDIWHNNKNLQFEDKKFRIFVGELLTDFFYDNGIFNCSFGYDYYKSKDLKPIHAIEQDILESTIKNAETIKPNSILKALLKIIHLS